MNVGLKQLLHYAAAALLALGLALTSHFLDWSGATTAIVGFLLIFIYALVSAPLSAGRPKAKSSTIGVDPIMGETHAYGFDPTSLMPPRPRRVRTGRNGD